MGTKINQNTTVEYTPTVQKTEKNADVQQLNSIMNSNEMHQNQNIPTEKTSTVLDDFYKRLAEKLKNYKINIEDLKHSDFLWKIIGICPKTFAKIPPKGQTKILNNAEEAIITAFVDSSSDKNGNIDLEKAKELAQKYNIALNTGWKLKDFKTAKQTSLAERMETWFGIKNFNSLPIEDKKNYIKKYFEGTILIDLEKAKTPEEKKAAFKKQLQDFGKLLANTPDEEKGVFREVILSLINENKNKALEVLLHSFDDPEKAKVFSEKFLDTDFMKRFGKDPDCTGNHMAPEDVATGISIATQVKSKENIQQIHQEVDEEARAFFENNKEILENIDKKIAEAKAKGIEPNLTDKEKEILLIRENIFKGIKSGLIIGTATNSNLSETDKKDILLGMNEDNFKLPIYEDILKNVSKAINSDKNKDLLTNLTSKDIIKILDKTSNGNYSTIANNTGADLKEPIARNNTADENSELAFLQQTTENAMQEALNNKLDLQKQIAQNSNPNNKIEVKKLDHEDTNYTKVNLREVTSKDLYTYIARGGDKRKLFNYCCDKYQEVSKSMQRFVENEFKTFGQNYKEIYLNTKLNFGGNALISFLNKTKTDVTTLNLNNLDTDYNTKKELQNELEKENI